MASYRSSLLLQMIGVSVARTSYMDGEEPDVGEMIVTTDYISAGNLIGEMGLLTSSRRNSSCTCESSVQVLFSFNIRFYIGLRLDSERVTKKLASRLHGVTKIP